MPKVVKKSEFGSWCEREQLDITTVAHLMGTSYNYASQLMRENGKPLSEFWERFFYIGWAVFFDDALRLQLISYGHPDDAEDDDDDEI